VAVIELHRTAKVQCEKKLSIVAGATSFQEPGTLEQVAIQRAIGFSEALNVRCKYGAT
jgi:hypothetical protein